MEQVLVGGATEEGRSLARLSSSLTIINLEMLSLRLSSFFVIGREALLGGAWLNRQVRYSWVWGYWEERGWVSFKKTKQNKSGGTRLLPPCFDNLKEGNAVTSEGEKKAVPSNVLFSDLLLIWSLYRTDPEAKRQIWKYM